MAHQQLTRISRAGAIGLAGLAAAMTALADTQAPVSTQTPDAAMLATASPGQPPAPAATPTHRVFGEPIAASTLLASRGGTDVFNDMKLKGVVADNHASRLSTGNNVVADGAFAGASGLPMVIQNSGNNVLIQSATIVNVQLQ